MSLNVCTQFGKSINISVFLEGDLSRVLSATRGPDVESNSLAKMFGACIIRSYIRGWNYGIIMSIRSLFNYIICSKPESEGVKQLFQECRNAGVHYAAHMTEAFRTLRDIFLFNKVSEFDLSFCEVMYIFWDIIYNTIEPMLASDPSQTQLEERWHKQYALLYTYAQKCLDYELSMEKYGVDSD